MFKKGALYMGDNKYLLNEYTITHNLGGFMLTSSMTYVT